LIYRADKMRFDWKITWKIIIEIRNVIKCKIFAYGISNFLFLSLLAIYQSFTIFVRL